MGKTEIHKDIEDFSETQDAGPIDAIPERDYPARILRAYLSTRWVISDNQELASLMNRLTEERNAWLRRAIAVLEATTSF